MSNQWEASARSKFWSNTSSKGRLIHSSGRLICLQRGKAEHSEYAIVAKQVYNDKAELEETVVEINSPRLYSVLQELVKYYSEKPLQFKTGVTFDSPFKVLTHYRTDLEKTHASADEKTKHELSLLLDSVEPDAGEK